VAFAPDNLAGVDSPKVVETEGNGCGKLLDFRVKLNAGTDAGEVVHDTVCKRSPLEQGLFLDKESSFAALADVPLSNDPRHCKSDRSPLRAAHQPLKVILRTEIYQHRLLIRRAMVSGGKLASY
jgi:hypothetical protein